MDRDIGVMLPDFKLTRTRMERVVLNLAWWDQSDKSGDWVNRAIQTSKTQERGGRIRFHKMIKIKMG